MKNAEDIRESLKNQEMRKEVFIQLKNMYGGPQREKLPFSVLETYKNSRN